MKSIQKRLAAVALAMLMALCGGLPLRASAEGSEGERQPQQVHTGAQSTMFSVLGLGFLCAGGMVVLLTYRDRG